MAEILNSVADKSGDLMSDAVIEQWWDNLCAATTKYPDFLKLDFHRPIHYRSSNVTPEKLQNNEFFIVHNATAAVVATSYAVRITGQEAVFQLEKNGESNREYIVRASTFQAITEVLKVVGADFIQELRSLLRDQRETLLSHISGCGKGIKRVRAALQELKLSPSASKNHSWIKWLELMNYYDVISVAKINSALSSTGQMPMSNVEAEYHGLRALSGWDSPRHPLKGINWDTDYVFEHGNRSPPWRQAHSELGYLEVRLHDREKLVITAAKNGLFVNKGFAKNEKGVEVLQYDRDIQSQVYPSLLAVLSSQSPHFTVVFSKFEQLVEAEYPTAQMQAEVEAFSKFFKITETLSRSPKTQKSASLGRRQSIWKQSGKAYDDSDNEDETRGKREVYYEPTPEYWQLQKLVKYLRAGNQTATCIALAAMRDCDLDQPQNQMAMRDNGALELLVNLLDTDHMLCIQGSLKILCQLSTNAFVRTSMKDLDAIKPLIKHLADVDPQTQCLAAQVLANCGQNGPSRALIRKYNGIRRLVNLLQFLDEEVARCAALALCSCSKSAKIKDAMKDFNALHLLGRLLTSKNEQLLVPVVGTLYQFALTESYRDSIRDQGMIEKLVSVLQQSKHRELQTRCAMTIFKCAENSRTRDIIQKVDGLKPLVSLLDVSSGKDLLSAVTGAIWKCAQGRAIVEQFIKMGGVKKLIALLAGQQEEVLINIVGALGACAQIAEGRAALREANGLGPLVQLLKSSDPKLLVNATKAVGSCALDIDCMAIIDKMDGVRLMWSLLKSDNTQVQASAAWAISPCIENAKDAGEMVRSFVGGLELVVSLLKSDNTQVLASVCAAIAKIARDEENLAVITDHGVVQMLAKLTSTKDDVLRASLAEAIANCCPCGSNRAAFGAAKAVGPLAQFLKSTNKNVHRATTTALNQLSQNNNNCVQMHEFGVVTLLLDLIGEGDEIQQVAAAGTLSNIRKIALAGDKAVFG